MHKGKTFTPEDTTTKRFWNQFKNKNPQATWRIFKLMFVDLTGRNSKKNTDHYCDSNKECL